MHGVDYYRVLGVPMSASSAQIKASYKNLAKKFHPDVNGDAKKMAAINEAYRVLSEPETRRQYDKSVEEASRKKARQHYSTSDGYVYTPHTSQQSPSRPRPQATRTRPYTPPKKSEKVSRWAWAATFAILLGVLLGTGLRSPIPDSAASTIGTNTTQQETATPTNTLNDTPPATIPTYSDPTSRSVQEVPENSVQQSCSRYRKYSRSYENCLRQPNSCNPDSSRYSYYSC